MIFTYEKNTDCVTGILHYFSRGFLFYPQNRDIRENVVYAYILVDYLAIAITEDRKALFVDGFCPYESWKKRILVPPAFEEGTFSVVFDDWPDEPLDLGMGYTFNSIHLDPFPEYVDFELGWYCMGNPEPSGDFQAIKFASNTIAVIQDGDLKAIWLHPEEFPSELKNIIK